MFFTALKSHGKSATFRQHYYPEGGWGWVICFCCFLVNIFTTGLQLSFSILYLKILQHCESEVGPEDKISIGKYLQVQVLKDNFGSMYHYAASKKKT